MVNSDNIDNEELLSLTKEIYLPIYDYYAKLSEMIFIKDECTLDIPSLEYVNKAAEVFISQNKRLLEKYYKKKK